jgi:hypothetical protein
MRTTLALLLAAAASAQSYVVSPIVYTRQEAPGNNYYPWNGPFRFQQVHTDLVGTPRPITGLAWRRNQDQFLPTGSPARTLDMEVLLCDSNAAAWSTTFASNYVGTPRLVFTRKNVNAPDWSPPIEERPAPFDHAIAFDTPAPYLAVNDLLYELVVYSSSTSATYMADSAVFPATVTSMWGTYSSVGTGCRTPTGTFLVRSQIQHVLASTTISFGWSVSGAPPGSGTVLVGLAPINVPVPGLCTNLYTLGMLYVPFTTGNTGSGNTTAASLPFDPSWTSIVLSVQAAAPDPSQTGLQVAASQGARCEIPAAMPAVRGARLWALGNPTATTGSTATSGWLVTRFRS